MSVEEEILKRKEQLLSIENAKRALEQKKINMKKRYQKRVLKMDADIQAQSDKLNQLSRLKIFNRDDVMPILAYLVSLIEDTNYQYDEKRIPVSWGFHGMWKSEWKTYQYPDSHYYHIAYLCKNKDHASEEINCYIESIIHEYIPDNLINELLLEPKMYYIQIAFYMDTKNICFHSNMNSHDRLYDVSYAMHQDDDYTFYYYQGNHHLRDKRYLYILEFMEYLSAIRTQKENCQLTVDEMMECARIFASQKKEEIIRVRKYLG